MRSRAEALTWTPELAEWAYNVYRALGWNEALDGNYIGAFSDMREAHNLAPTLPWRIEAILDRAYLFGEIGESVAAHERFNEADQLCKQIDWARSSEERRVLLWAAEIGAQLNPARASSLIARYKAIRRPIDATLVAGKNSRRWRAHEHDAFGAVGGGEWYARHCAHAFSYGAGNMGCIGL